MRGTPNAIHHSQTQATLKSPTGRTSTTIVGGSNGPASTRADVSISTLDETGTFTLNTVHDGWCQYGGHFLAAAALIRLFSAGVITSSYVKVADFADGTTASYDKNCQAGINYARTCGAGNYRLVKPGFPHSFAHMPFISFPLVQIRGSNALARERLSSTAVHPVANKLPNGAGARFVS